MQYKYYCNETASICYTIEMNKNQLHTKKKMKGFNQQDIDALINKSRTSPRKREAVALHPAEKRGTRCIVNCIQPDSYVAPHLHPSQDGQEIWVPYQGRIALITFYGNGTVKDRVYLSRDEHNFVEIPERTFHTAVALSEDSIMYEFSEGPYVPSTYKEFATWAPSENDTKRAAEFLQILKSCLS